MDGEIETSDPRELARKRLQKRRDFTAHLVTYVVVNSMLIGLWAITGAGYFWPAWVLLGWGVGLVLNAWDVFFRRPITDADIDRELERRQRRPA
jgi:2TM domain